MQEIQQLLYVLVGTMIAGFTGVAYAAFVYARNQVRLQAGRVTRTDANEEHEQKIRQQKEIDELKENQAIIAAIVESNHVLGQNLTGLTTAILDMNRAAESRAEKRDEILQAHTKAITSVTEGQSYLGDKLSDLAAIALENRSFAQSARLASDAAKEAAIATQTSIESILKSELARAIAIMEGIRDFIIQTMEKRQTSELMQVAGGLVQSEPEA